MKLTAKIILSAIMASSLQGAFAEGLTFTHPGDKNSMVRIDSKAHYLLLPIEEAMPDARIDVLVDGNLVKTFYARLADHKVDFSVPFDITPYTSKGNVVLNVVASGNPDRTRKNANAICWSRMELTDTFNTENTEKYRPAYHHTPLYGWMNDPNGMFYKDGEWHLYYQYNPYGSKWQNMTWAHSVSRDLINWEHLPLAIEPNGLGTVFSGSSVVDHNNTAGFGKDAVIAIYTSAAESQVQSLAHSSDNGRTFDIYPGNPIISTDKEARDPNMFWNDEIGKWNLILAGAGEHEMLLFSSSDLKEWTLESHFGQGYGCQDGVWECADLFKLPIKGSDEERWVLICNINPGSPWGGSATQYFIGDFDGHKFTTETAPEVAKWMDFGKDHYAAVTWSGAPDSRRTAIAWMSNWQYANEVPTRQFRSANTIARDLGLFRAPDGEVYLSSTPVPEMESLRGKKKSYGAHTVTKKSVSYELPDANGLNEILLGYDLKGAGALLIELSNSKGEKVAMRLDAAEKIFSMDRTASGLTDFSADFAATTTAPTFNDSNVGTLRLFLDRCSIEAFDGEGRFAMTNLVFPTEPYTTITVSALDGKARITSFNAYPLTK
jgi:sucrose-6-phosphate hydrolase SacC (GH32 family)